MATEQSELSERQFGWAAEINQNSSGLPLIAHHTLARSFRPVRWETERDKQHRSEERMIELERMNVRVWRLDWGDILWLYFYTRAKNSSVHYDSSASHRLDLSACVFPPRCVLLSFKHPFSAPPLFSLPFLNAFLRFNLFLCRFAFYQIKPPPSLISSEETRVSPTAAFSSLKDRLPDISKCNQGQRLVSLWERLKSTATDSFFFFFSSATQEGNNVSRLFQLLE